MSCWIVSNDHINLLVTAEVCFFDLNPAAAAALGQILFEENVRSFNYHYSDRYLEDIVERGPYSFEPKPSEDLVHVYAQSVCYDYQACEHPDYKTSPSWLFVETLQLAIQNKLGLTDTEIRDLPASAAAPWGI